MQKFVHFRFLDKKILALNLQTENQENNYILGQSMPTSRSIKSKFRTSRDTSKNTDERLPLPENQLGNRNGSNSRTNDISSITGRWNLFAIPLKQARLNKED